ncbi:BRCT domain-containing protein [Dyella amyloliquefaciens]|uniref:BRCT domain-containing protein n=1 Tax=Dyella amyloliquefaciens TaxID=1770545 RepID=UPI00102E9699|nr:BRCT domain-containing protein [Dyella amyloliquefaciens]
MGLFSFGAPIPKMTERARQDRCTDELIGICRGVIADGSVNVQEARFLLNWLERHREFLGIYPFDILHRRIQDAMFDGVLDSDEERDLLDVLSRTVGGESHAAGSSTSLSTALPFDVPPPVITFPGQVFAVTGIFTFGQRTAVVEAIQGRGGVVKPAMSKKVRFLVVGEIGSRDWNHSSFGRKIEEAVALRAGGENLSIVSEELWAKSLG